MKTYLRYIVRAPRRHGKWEYFMGWHDGKIVISQRGINLDDSMTVEQFIALTKNAYGGDIIGQLSNSYED